MLVQSLIELVDSGNTGTVEEEWIRLIDSESITPIELARFAPVLSELAKKDQTDQAEALASAALDSLLTQFSPTEVLAAAGPMLLVLKKSTALRRDVAEIYRKAYGERPGFDALLTEAGLEGGRPVRRALRTLEVCLSIEPGDYLLDRHEPTAARVVSIDTTDWQVTFRDTGGESELGPVEFADRFRRAEANEFHVLRQFDRERLLTRIQKDPGGIVVEICESHGNRFDSDRLETLLTPDLIGHSEWKKWWTRARAALKQHSAVTIEGRTPYLIFVDDTIESLEQKSLRDFRALHDPVAQWAHVEKYLRGCKQRKTPPDPALIDRFYERFESVAREHVRSGAKVALRDAILARRCAVLRQGCEPCDLAVDLLRDLRDLAGPLGMLYHDEKLLREAFDCLRVARPDDWKTVFLDQLTQVPASICDHLTGALVEAGYGLDTFGPLVENVLNAPLEHHELLLWLYDGPAHESSICDVTPLKLLTRVLGVLADMLRRGDLAREQVNQVVSRTRSVLSARKLERFRRCIEDLDEGMPRALKARISRLDSLGNALQQDMLSALSQRYDLADKTEEVSPWLREDVLFVSAAGLSKRRSEIEHLVNVKMKENARAIGEAAAHGDLSENAEYKFALEERDLLQSQRKRMEDELTIAKVIAPEDVPTDSVGIGSKIALKNVESGLTTEVILVGPWEADLDQHRYNYKAPFAQNLMGRKIGDHVELALTQLSGTFEIIGISDGLA